MSGIKALPPSDLYRTCDLSRLDVADSSGLKPLEGTLGQERALESIEFGVRMAHEGYNLYLMGSDGLGKHRLIQQALEQHCHQAPPPYDWCYIANFTEPHRPLALRLPPGLGRRLRHDLQQLVQDLLKAVPAAFQSSTYTNRAEALNKEFKTREEAAAQALGRKAKDQGIALIHTPTGYTLAPVRDGHILGSEDFEKLSEQEQQELERVMEALKEELKRVMSQLPAWQHELRARIKELDQEVVRETVVQLVAELEQSYRELPEVLAHLAAIKTDVVENLDQFRQADGEEHSADELRFNRYKVNLLVDNAEAQGAPVIYENNPTYLNLIGRVEHIARMGNLVTDFTLIKPGALHRANGGYLVLDATKLLMNGFAWDALKRVLKAKEIRIETLERLLSLGSTTFLEPQPIPLDTKVALVGERLLYYLLHAYDPELGQLFKVASDFSEDMPRNDGNDRLYARFLAAVQQREGLRPLNRSALELIVEHAARLAGDSTKLSLRISNLLDLLRESDHFAGRADHPLVLREHVQQALDAQRRRLDQMRERMQEEILRGTLMIDTHGSQLGRVNALTVVFSGEHAFGLPSRVSATARLGGGELLDIQREVDQAGPIHSKGVLILAAYLGRRYAKYQPLSLAATLVFEQTYGQIEGDSASAAELCALLSAIGDIPLKQSLAITGSVNQHGELQAIGGVNEKIEGFFDICQARGLDGSHGIILPAANRTHLMLHKDVVEAVAAGAFHIWCVDHVDQAMELLTGQMAGRPDADGVFPMNSVNGQVQLRLAEWFQLRQQLAAGEHGRTQSE
jgi:lon-related putative ATP-dependent protease